VDIEHHHDRSLFDYASLCTSKELDWLSRWLKGGSYTEKEAFLILWSAKEAVLKTLGVGLSVDPRHIGITFPHHEPYTWISVIDGVELFGYYRTVRHNRHDYALSWCSSLWSENIQYGDDIAEVYK
jgi:phosphopantetheinyl transferase